MRWRVYRFRPPMFARRTSWRGISTSPKPVSSRKGTSFHFLILSSGLSAIVLFLRMILPSKNITQKRVNVLEIETNTLIRVPTSTSLPMKTKSRINKMVSPVKTPHINRFFLTALPSFFPVQETKQGKYSCIYTGNKKGKESPQTFVKLPGQYIFLVKRD